jgi:hypothetical protein
MAATRQMPNSFSTPGRDGSPVSKPSVNRFKTGAALASPALPTAKPREARCRTKFPRQGALPARPIEGLKKDLFRVCFRIRRIYAQQHFPLHAKQLGQAPSLLPARAVGKRVTQDVDALLEVANAGKGMREFDEHFETVDISLHVRRSIHRV